jgi:hypothetical protein
VKLLASFLAAALAVAQTPTGVCSGCGSASSTANVYAYPGPGASCGLFSIGSVPFQIAAFVTGQGPLVEYTSCGQQACYFKLSSGGYMSANGVCITYGPYPPVSGVESCSQGVNDFCSDVYAYDWNILSWYPPLPGLGAKYRTAFLGWSPACTCASPGTCNPTIR